jgi:hypothetical protein
MIDTSKMGSMGWSQGGYISAFLTTNTNVFKAISVGAVSLTGLPTMLIPTLRRLHGNTWLQRPGTIWTFTSKHRP